jgi:hypothetical protein
MRGGILIAIARVRRVRQELADAHDDASDGNVAMIER